MSVKFDLLLTDWMILFLFFSLIVGIFFIRKHPHLREPWANVFKKKLGMVAFIILSFYAMIGTLDSIHLQITKNTDNASQTTTVNRTVFELLIGELGQVDELTYSKPLATHAHQRAWVISPHGKEIYTYPRLKHAGNHLKDLENHHRDIAIKIVISITFGLASFLIICSLILWPIYRRQKSNHINFLTFLNNIAKGKTRIAWREAILTLGFLWTLVWVLAFLASGYHLFGTNKIGEDVFFETIKSIRTGLLIGTLTTIIMLPFALFFGMIAGYFSGFIDDIIQYVYTTLSSIPGVLLISAMVLVMQIYIANHPQMFPTIADRADARLLALCFILGLTSWASLCRLLRAETLKIREYDFVTASITMGAKPFHILFRHILPNVMHIVLITIVLDFSGLVLAESILSYVGVGVDPTTSSWGNIINTSRLELAREPMVWWPLFAALLVMFFFVLSANIFADAVRDAFDPKLHNT